LQSVSVNRKKISISEERVELVISGNNIMGQTYQGIRKIQEEQA